jgi:hypothetical protein
MEELARMARRLKLKSINSSSSFSFRYHKAESTGRFLPASKGKGTRLDPYFLAIHSYPLARQFFNLPRAGVVSCSSGSTLLISVLL